MKNTVITLLLGLILTVLIIIAIALIAAGCDAQRQTVPTPLPTATPTPAPTNTLVPTPTPAPTWTPVPTWTPAPTPIIIVPPTPIIIVATPTPAPTIVTVYTPTPWVVTATPTPELCWTKVPKLTNRKIIQASAEALWAQLISVRRPQCLPEGSYDLDKIVIAQSLMADTLVPCHSHITLTYFDRALKGICHPAPTPTIVPPPPPPPPPPPQCPPEEGEIYVVQPGDWITKLCRERGYNEASGKLMWCVRWVVDHSYLPDPNRLRPWEDQLCLPHPFP